MFPSRTPPRGSRLSRPALAGALALVAMCTVTQWTSGVPAAVAGGSTSASIAPAAGTPVIATRGPSNSLWVYWEAANAHWYGPLGVGNPGSAYSSPSVATNAQGLSTIAVEGPNGTVWLYWEAANAQWYGPLGVGAPAAASSPPAVAYTSAGLPVVAVEGPDYSLYIYWEAANAQWYGPLGIGPVGSTYSAPSITMGASGLPVIAAQGPDNSLWVYSESTSAQWSTTMGVGSVGSTYSSPSMASGPSGQPTIAVEGPGNSLWIFWEAGDNWYGPLGVGAPGSTNAEPSIVVNHSGLPTVAVQGPGDTLYTYWEAANAQWYGPLGVGGPQSTNAGPALTLYGSGLPVVATESQGNGLWVYWEAANAQWYGPLGVGGPQSNNPSVDPGTLNPPPAPQTAAGDVASEVATGKIGVSDTPSSTSFSFDCNPFTHLDYGTTTAGCGVDPTFSVQNASEEWCSDFAKWVWAQTGVSSGLLTPSAASFVSFAESQGEPVVPFSGTPQVGDAVVFFPPGPIGSFADHVGIVSAVNLDGTVDLVNGDFLDGSNIQVEQDDDVVLGTYASDIWSPGEQWVFVAP